MKIIDFINECEAYGLMPKNEFDKLRLEILALELKARNHFNHCKIKKLDCACIPLDSEAGKISFLE